MLAVNRYPKEYVDECRSRVASHVSAYKKLASAAAGEGSSLGAAVREFESVFFNNMVLVLESYFTHRTRALEKKDGNPLNEVRVMCNSMMHHDDIMTMDKSINLVPDKSVLKYQSGDRLALTEEEFSRIAAAFFSEVESKYL